MSNLTDFWGLFSTLSDGIGIWTITFVVAVFVTSYVKRNTYGNQLESVKNALGFALAYLILIAALITFALLFDRSDALKLFGFGLIISILLSICHVSALCSWAYGAWLGRAERDQLLKLDIPVVFFGVIAIVMAW